MTLLEHKDQSMIPATVLLCEVTKRNGDKLFWSSAACSLGAQTYSPRLSQEHSAQWKFQSDLSAENSASIEILLANADGAVSELRRTGELKGAGLKLSVGVLEGRQVEDAYVIYTGTVDNVLDSDSRFARVTVMSRLNAVRSSFPPMRIQKQCSWTFPKSEAERQAALSSGEDGRYSPLFRCGYSAGLPGGSGNLNGAEAFTSCSYTRAACEERGMFDRDASSQITRRFNGLTYVPPIIQIRGHGESSGRLSQLVSLDTRYNDVVPAVYGMGWLQAPVVFSRNDGNLTRSEVLIGLGEIDDVVKVVVNGYEIPRAVDGRNMTGTGWFNLISNGGRTGGFNLNFTNSAGAPQGDPYGSLAYLSVVVPNKISDAKSTPKVEVLLKGIRLPILNAEGDLVDTRWSSNPAWIICDILRRTGWKLAELNLASFVEAAAYCDQLIDVVDSNGATRQTRRFETNLVLRRRYSVSELLRGIRLASLLRLGLDATGRIYVAPESTLSVQQASKPAGSNATSTQAGGWAAYEFDDGKYGRHGFLLRNNYEAEFQLYSNSSQESANRVSAELQDSLNEFRQDSFSLADTDDIAERRQEIQQALPVLGLPNLPQAIRVGQTWLNKSIAGNIYARFRTTLRGIHLRPGQLISLTFEKHGLDKTIFRVLETKIDSRLDSLEITAQLHQDHWYSDDPQARYDRGRLYSWANRSPRAVLLLEPSEELALDLNGVEKAALTIPFVRPRVFDPTLSVPLVSFQYSVSPTSGALGPGSYFYGLTALDSAGKESALSTLIPVNIATTGNNHAVSLSGLSFSSATASVNLYRGSSPYRLQLVASGLNPASLITDNGSSVMNELPPDANYSKLRAYFRRQYLPNQSADSFSANTIGKTGLGLTPDEWKGKLIVIREGKGRGQERLILSHTASVFTLATPWLTIPDATSKFSIVHAEWTSAQESESDSIRVFLPLLSTESFEVNLRSVGVDADELDAAESPSLVWQIGVGTSGGGLDSGPAPEPSFGFSLLEGGTISIGGFAFSSFANLNTAYAAKLGLLYWDELNAPTPLSLNQSISATDTTLVIDGLAQPLVAGDVVQLGQEICRIVSRLGATNAYEIERGAHLSPISGHTIPLPVFLLERRDEVITLLPGLLNSTAGARFRYNTRFPNVRIAAADMAIYNRFGGGALREECYTQVVDNGIRTLSGSQIAFSVAGYLSIESSAASPFVTDRLLAVGDVYAVVVEPPVGAHIQIMLRVNGAEWCNLNIAAGSFTSSPVSRFNHAPIPEGATLTFDITNVPPASLGTPGKDLTVFLQV